MNPRLARWKEWAQSHERDHLERCSSPAENGNTGLSLAVAAVVTAEEMRRVDTLVVTEQLSLPLDEGGTIATVNMIDDLPGRVLLLNRTNGITPTVGAGVHQFRAGRSLVEKLLRYGLFVLATIAAIIRYRPAKVLYFPLCDPPAMFQLHARLLSFVSANFTEVLFQVTGTTRMFSTLSKFDIQVASPVDQKKLAAVGVSAKYAKPRFKSPQNTVYDYVSLRRKYGLSEEDFVISHIGHPNPFRGLDIVAATAERNPSLTFLIVLSSRLAHPEFGFPENVILITEHIDDVYEIYAISDVYLFPLRNYAGSISTPLTLLEAMHAGIAIVCSDLPTLRAAVDDYDNAFFVDPHQADAASEFANCLEKIRISTHVSD